MSEPACSSGLMLVTGYDNTLASCARLASKALMQPVECDELSSRARECYIRLLRLVICMSWANGQDPEMVWRAVVEFVETAEYNDLESKAVVEPFAPPTGKTPCPSRFGHGPGKRKNPYELTAEAGAAVSTDAAADGSGCVGSTMLGPSLKQQRTDGSEPFAMSQECSQAAPAHADSVPCAGRPAWLLNAPILMPAGDCANPNPQDVLPTAVSVPASASTGKQAIECWRGFDCEHRVMERF